jgi:ribosomal protein S27E
MTDPREMLDGHAIARLRAGYCPDCGHRGFILGPRGGASTNIECGGCGNRFNIAQSSRSHHIIMGARIASQADGGSDWS